MKILHIDYNIYPYPVSLYAWINDYRLYWGIWEAVAQQQQVKVIQCMTEAGTLQKSDIQYDFLKRSAYMQLFPFFIHRRVVAEQPDVVIVHSLSSPLQLIQLRRALGRKAKIIVQHHAEQAFKNPLKKWLQRIADTGVDACFFTAYGLADPWVKKGLIKNAGKVKEVMETSSVFSLTGQDEARMVTGVKGTHTYLWVGRLNENKDPLLVLKVFTEFLRNTLDARLFLIFQTEELLDEIRIWLQAHPETEGRVILIGKLPHRQLQYWYSSVDFIISSSHYEGSGVAVCEAMSCGCIPVLTAIPSFEYMTSGQCGLLYKPGDEKALYKALMTSTEMDKPAERQKSLHQYNSRLSFAAIAKSIQEIIASLQS